MAADSDVRVEYGFLVGEPAVCMDDLLKAPGLERQYGNLMAGPYICLDELLKESVRKAFGVEVQEVWDFRDYQDLLYRSASTTKMYTGLTGGCGDAGLVDNAAAFLDENDMLDERITLVAGGCGPANREISFYRSLTGRGYDVTMELYDASPWMLQLASDNCRKEGIIPRVYCSDFLNLNRNDFDPCAQTLFSLFGGTFFNLQSRYSFAHRMSGRFRFRHRESETYKNDLLLIQGDVEKDMAYYAGLSSKIFLAEGLMHLCGIEIESLMIGGKLAHMAYPNPDTGTVQCVYLVTKDQPPFLKGAAIRVIRSGLLDFVSFRPDMARMGFDVCFVGPVEKRAIAVCSSLLAAGKK